jgi:cobalt transporter subunit CbtB
MNTATQTSVVLGIAIPSRVAAGAAALLVGFALFFATGFATPGLLHNATHDMRHSLGLPCH